MKTSEPSTVRPTMARRTCSFSLLVAGFAGLSAIGSLTACGRKSTETNPAFAPPSTSIASAKAGASSIPGLLPPSADCPDMGDGNAIAAYDWATRYRVSLADAEVLKALPTLDHELDVNLRGLDRPLFEACASIVKELGGPGGSLGTHDTCVAAEKALADAKVTLGPTGSIALDVQRPTCAAAPATPADCATSCAGDPAACRASCETRRISHLECLGVKVTATVKGGDAALVAKLQRAIESGLPALVVRAASHDAVMALLDPTIQVLRGIDSHLGAIALPDDQRAKLGQCVVPLEQHLQAYFAEWGDGDELAKSVRASVGG